MELYRDCIGDIQELYRNCIGIIGRPYRVPYRDYIEEILELQLGVFSVGTCRSACIAWVYRGARKFGRTSFAATHGLIEGAAEA